MAKITSHKLDIEDIIIANDKLLHGVYLLIISALAVITVIMLGRNDQLMVIVLIDLIIVVFGVIWTSFIVLFHIYQKKLQSTSLISGPYQGKIIPYIVKSFYLAVIVELFLYYSFMQANGGINWYYLIASVIALVWVVFFVFIGLYAIRHDIAMHYPHR